MSLLDNLMDKLRGPQDNDYQEDEYFDEYEGQEAPQYQSSGLLGNTSRPEVNSVNVYTRGGRRVENEGYSSSYGEYSRPQYVPTAPYASAVQPAQMSAGYQAQLPPYVLRPVSYDDVQTVITRVRTDQPVVLVFKNTNIDIAKRILDFCFGLSCGINGSVKELDDKVFVVLPADLQLGKADLENLASQGIISMSDH